LSEKRKILVTGTQRSGTTWLGNILSAGRTAGYIHEPFNTTNVQLHNSPISIPYQYIDSHINTKEQNKYSNYLDYFLHPGLRFFCNALSPIKKIDSRYLLPGYQNYLAKKNSPISIIKDPFALLSCEWLHKQHDWEVVIIIRHPAAFALSMKEKSWIVTPTVFMNQLDQLDHIYAGYHEMVNSYLAIAKKKDDLIGSSILGWNLLHIAIDYYRQKFPNWIYLRHEDLSHNPLTAYNKLYDLIGLEYTQDVIGKVKQSTTGMATSGVNRDSEKNVLKWKNTLSKEEINRIKEETFPIWTRFYGEEDW